MRIDRRTKIVDGVKFGRCCRGDAARSIGTGRAGGSRSCIRFAMFRSERLPWGIERIELDMRDWFGRVVPAIDCPFDHSAQLAHISRPLVFVELAMHMRREIEAGVGNGAARIEIADLKERIKKLEAIASGVDL
jgi:hypothetical protein